LPNFFDSTRTAYETTSAIHCRLNSLCSGTFYTEPLPSNINIQTQADGTNFYLRRSDGLRFHDIHTKFYEVRFRHLKINGGGFEDINTQREGHVRKIGQKDYFKLNVMKSVCVLFCACEILLTFLNLSK
jgi:hypothetical protein